MTAVLGISALYHDAAAALVVDGEVVAAIQQERLSRRKNDASLPKDAALACLSLAGLSATDLAAVVFYEDPFARLDRVLLSTLRSFPRAWRQFPHAIRSQIGSKVWVLDNLAFTLGISRNRVSTVAHHQSHAASAFFASAYDEAAVLTIDGVGESDTTGLWMGKGSSLECLGTIEFPHSLGLLYAALTAYLGFEVNEGEFKVMGLAAFGAPKYTQEFSKLIKIREDGSFELSLSYFAFHTDVDLGFNAKLEELLGPRRPRGKPWDLQSSPEDRRYADIAATLQRFTEDAIVALAKAAKRLTSSEFLCMAGGVALNCVANARVVQESGFKNVFVQPAAGDAGGALGAAYLGYIQATGKRPARMRSALLGPSISNDKARNTAAALGLKYTEPSDIFDEVAKLVLDDKIVALARGRVEWGPRALGSRSLLASPKQAEMRDRMNRAVKRREPFRPFAPAVLRSEAHKWFDHWNNDLSPYMTGLAIVKPECRAQIAATTHVDGTARIQTVDEDSSPDLCKLLQVMKQRNEAPIMLNTSLNGNGEPIVCDECDALAFFLSHPIDALVLEDILLQRTSS